MDHTSNTTSASHSTEAIRGLTIGAPHLARVACAGTGAALAPVRRLEGHRDPDLQLLQKIDAGLDAMYRINMASEDDLGREVAAARLAGDWDRFVFLHRSREWLDAFEAHAPEMSDAAYWPLLTKIYSTYSTVTWAKNRFLALFHAQRLGREASMCHISQDVFDALPSEVRVYRGFAGGDGLGMSWTLSRRIAKFFAYRAQEWRGSSTEQPTVMSGVATKTDILTVICSRGEYEVVIDPKRVRRRRHRALRPCRDQDEFENLIA